MADHGSRQSYADGCRCASCKAAQATYRREWQARKAGATVTELPRPGRKPKTDAPRSITEAAARAQEELPIGPTEAAVIEELASLTSAETRKGAAQAALAMARILDNPLALTQQPPAAARLTTILEDLRKGSARRKGRLASVQAMTKSAAG
jgi:hypothetical protein